MRKIALVSILICACALAQAQIANYVKNPSFEDTIKCPYQNNQLSFAQYWHCAVDTVGEPNYAPEYTNACAGTNLNTTVPTNLRFYQKAHTGVALIAALLYYDKTPPPPPFVTSNFRDYAQGHLHEPLQNGKTYCISFWVVLAEYSGYAHNHIGAYLDNGQINKRSPAGDMITDVVPQLATSTKIKDTMNWTKVEGSFVANGTETHISLGNFAKQADVDTDAVPYYAPANQYSYYLFDDISVIPIDLNADAGKDTWVEQGKQVQIGRVGDTTAMGLDCKWYKKGILIDSGAIITVNANALKNAIDTYVVVQSICGIIKRDTVAVKTTGVGISLLGGARGGFSIYPNPSSGTISITSLHAVLPTKEGTIHATVYDLLGRIVHQEPLSFSNKEATLKLNIPTGSYILELQDEAGHVQRERIVIE